ncbi:Protein of unknown function [Pyronema omphalodes CBS 100304]|uniref:Uncharacterized protein n=1 Tax=Pyronema omphalodes (strain CBS 100304) TaxID=1076935 RepID=U4LJD2_PYROM|nr:Protein of unknown function [Pyronema omphalodes CBS 100304]
MDHRGSQMTTVYVLGISHPISLSLTSFRLKNTSGSQKPKQTLNTVQTWNQHPFLRCSSCRSGGLSLDPKKQDIRHRYITGCL